MMNRRTFLCGLTLGTLSAPLATDAQQTGKVYRIGFLTPVALPRYVEVFRQGLRERGYVEGTNILLEWRSTEGRPERYADFAAELIRLNVDVIVTTGNEATDAAKRATSAIPIVMATSSLPAELGLVASLARPGGNVTGMSIDTGPEVAGKMLQFLKEAAPKVSRVGVILGKAVGAQRDAWVEPAGRLAKEIDEAARRLRVSLQTVAAYEPVEFERAFVVLGGARSEGLLVSNSAQAFVHRRLIVELAAKRRLPGVYCYRDFAEDGGMIAYGVDLADLVRRAAGYIDRILKGAKPADLPVEQPTKFELVINLKTAKALGLTIPQSLLLRADQVIE